MAPPKRPGPTPWNLSNMLPYLTKGNQMELMILKQGEYPKLFSGSDVIAKGLKSGRGGSKKDSGRGSYDY